MLLSVVLLYNDFRRGRETLGFKGARIFEFSRWYMANIWPNWSENDFVLETSLASGALQDGQDISGTVLGPFMRVTVTRDVFKPRPTNVILVKNYDSWIIMITCPCNEHPFTPRFYIVWLGFTNVYPRFMFLANIRKISLFYLKIAIFTAVKYCSKLHGHVCVIEWSAQMLPNIANNWNILYIIW